MNTYVYQYIDGHGRRRLAWQQAESAAACCALLAECDIYPVRVIGLKRPAIFAPRGIHSRQLALLLRQLSLALSSGVAQLEALHHLSQEQAGERQRTFVARLEAGVLAGQPLSEVLRQSGGVSPMLCQWLAIGERQGRLAEVMADIARYLEGQERIKKRIQQQLIYPMMVLLAVLLVGALLSLVVMPMLARQFIGFSQEVPFMMRFFLLVHDVLAQYGGVLLLALVAVIAGAWLLWQQRGAEEVPGREWLRRLVLRLPILKKIVVLRAYVSFARLFGQLLRSGVPVGETMDELERYFARSLFASDIRALIDAMRHGGKLSLALAETAFVPPLARQMLMNGEHYGRLPEALLETADYYETTLFEELSLWIRFIEPLSVILLGALVLLMALGLFVPVLESYQALLAQ